MWEAMSEGGERGEPSQRGWEGKLEERAWDGGKPDLMKNKSQKEVKSPYTIRGKI